jgi:hypothetical protein
VDVGQLITILAKQAEQPLKSPFVASSSSAGGAKPAADASSAAGAGAAGDRDGDDDEDKDEEGEPSDPDDEPDEEPKLTPPLEQWQREVGMLYIEGFKHYAVESNDPNTEQGYVRHRVGDDWDSKWCLWMREIQQGGTTNYMRTELPEGSMLRYHVDDNDQGYFLVADTAEGHTDAPDSRNLSESDRPDFLRS